MYLGLAEVCQDYALANILQIVQNVMGILQIIVPIVSIVALIKLLIRKMANPEDKKTKNGFRNWIVLFLSFFLLPIIINAVMGAIAYAESPNPNGEEFSFAACWNYARGRSNIHDEGSYKPTAEEQNKTKITD